ncbi:MAG: hypothetical protein ABI406_06700 [Ktedonobacteraceae bacterium]
MKDVDIRQLRWNDWNIEHIGRPGHEATQDEVEEIVASEHSFGQIQPNGRIFVLGITTQGRYLATVIDPEVDGIWYCVSARTASKKERIRYHQERAKRRPTDE